MAAFEYKGVCCRCKTAEVVCPPAMDPDWTPEEQADVRAGWEETRVELEAETPAGEARRIGFIRALMENLMCKPCAAAQIQAALQEAVREHQERADHPVVSDGMPACDIRGCKRQSCGYAEVVLCNPDGSAIPLTSTIVLSDGRRQPASEPTRLWICASHSAQAEENGLQGMQVAFTVEAAPAAIILAEPSRARAQSIEMADTGRRLCLFHGCKLPEGHNSDGTATPPPGNVEIKTASCNGCHKPLNKAEDGQWACQRKDCYTSGIENYLDPPLRGPVPLVVDGCIPRSFGTLLSDYPRAVQEDILADAATCFTLTPDEMKALGKFNTVERLTDEEAARLRALRGGA